MIVSIHQPHFLPWLGYFNKALNSDAFVWLNTVQYRERYYQNRCRIKSGDGWSWLTLPVFADRLTMIEDVRLADEGWKERVRKTLQRTYGRVPYFHSCSGPLFDAIESSSHLLDDVNLKLFAAVLELMGGSLPRIARSSDLPVDNLDPTGRLVDTVLALGGTTYLAGRGGQNYMDLDQFERAGIRVAWQDFDFNSVEYPQSGNQFVPGLSIVDCLFNSGPEETRRLIIESWSPEPLRQVSAV
jgi:hypothetical protein